MFRYFDILDDFLNRFLGHNVKNYNWLNHVISKFAVYEVLE